MVHPHNEVLLSDKKEWNNYPQNMGESWLHFTKWKKPDQKGYILHDSTYMTSGKGKTIEMKNKLIISRDWVWGKGLNTKRATKRNC